MEHDKRSAVDQIATDGLPENVCRFPSPGRNEWDFPPVKEFRPEIVRASEPRSRVRVVLPKDIIRSNRVLPIDG
jgi:hypothetical protein